MTTTDERADHDAPTAAQGSATRPDGAGHLAPDPARYDEERNALARARGLDAPYIAGGEDADPDRSARDRRLYGRLLVLMIVLIVGTGLVLTFIALAGGHVGFDSGG